MQQDEWDSLFHVIYIHCNPPKAFYPGKTYPGGKLKHDGKTKNKKKRKTEKYTS